MEFLLKIWNNGSLVQALITCGVTLLSSLLVIKIISIFSKDKHRVLIESILIALITGALIFFLGGGPLGIGSSKGGLSTTDDGNGKPVKETDYKVAEIHLTNQGDSEETFKFILNDKEINMKNWEEALKEELGKYNNLKMVIIENSDNIPQHFYIRLGKIFGEKQIEFKELEKIQPPKEFSLQYAKDTNQLTFEGKQLDMNDWTDNLKEQLPQNEKVKITLTNPIDFPQNIKDELKKLSTDKIAFVGLE